MAFTTIASAAIEVGKAIKKSLLTQIKDNFDDHETRIDGLEGSVNKIPVMEYFIEAKDLNIGQIIPADMTLTEWQNIHGTGWIIADGSSCVGSLYETITGHTIVPDLQDEFLRGVSGSVTLGTAYPATTALPTSAFTTSNPGNHTHTIPKQNGAATGNFDPSGSNSAGGSTVTSSGAGGHTHTISGGDSETRPQNFGVNFFIKINLSAMDNVLRVKAREDMTIVEAKAYVVDINGLPTSGNMEFDILKGATIGALSTVYSVKPTLAYSGGIADGDATSTGTVLAGGFDVTSGDWFQLDITSMMPGASGIYIQVYAEPA